MSRAVGRAVYQICRDQGHHLSHYHERNDVIYYCAGRAANGLSFSIMEQVEHATARERERIALAIEVERDAWCSPPSFWKGLRRRSTFPAAWTWLSHAAAIARREQ